MDFIVVPSGAIEGAGLSLHCALGKGGIVAAEHKREGDGKSPAGRWPIRRVLYRPDRGAPPNTALPVEAIHHEDGWCDDPADPNYNGPVKLPYPASAERMWRGDGVYDIVVVLGHNDSPAHPGLGSAIFMHLARPDYAPTEGCVALARPDLEALLAVAKPGDAVQITLSSPVERSETGEGDHA